ncbi:MAG: hypothetical protein WCQ96_04015 [Patescibacteria group bacterium]
MEKKTDNKVSRGLFDINSMTGKMFFAITAIVFFLVTTEATTLNESIRATLSLAVIILPILAAEPIFESKRPIVLPFLIAGLIIFLGTIFFDLWPYKEGSVLYLSFAIIYMAGIFLRIFLRLLKEVNLPKMKLVRTDSASEIVGQCLEAKSFRMMLVLELWMLLLGTLSFVLTGAYVHDEMAGIYEIFFFMACSVLFSFSNLSGMLSITKKVKKSPLSIISFAIITPIAIPLCIIYFLILLSISEKLAGW